MPLIERTAYPRFSPRPSAGELARLYTPTLRELDLARRATRGGEAQQLAFLVMLKGFQRLGYFPKADEVPGTVVAHLRSRLGLTEEVAAAPSTRSRQRYRDAIRADLGVKAFGDDARRVAAEAVAGAALAMDDPADLVNVAIEELVKDRFELPAFSTLDRLVRHTRYTTNSRLFSRVDARMTNGMKRNLDALLETGPGTRSDLNLLKEVPKSATKKNLSEMQERLLWLQSLGDTETLLEGLPNAKVEHLSAQARALDASELTDFGAERRRAMLVCLTEEKRHALPVEFTVAAYRFVHSQVRPNYVVRAGGTPLPLFAPDDDTGGNDLRGSTKLTEDKKVGWEQFFNFGSVAPTPTRLIDTRLSEALFRMFPGPPGEGPDVPPEERMLAFRNMRRGVAMGLPSGEAVVNHMIKVLGENGRPTFGIRILSDDELGVEYRGRRGPGETPLWYWILDEAGAPTLSNGTRLGPVGARIVAEVFVGLLDGDERSFLNEDPGWEPREEFKRNGVFDMAALLVASGDFSG